MGELIVVLYIILSIPVCIIFLYEHNKIMEVLIDLHNKVDKIKQNNEVSTAVLMSEIKHK